MPEPTPAAGLVAVGAWAQVTTAGGCLKVRVSFEADAYQVDCLPFKLLVFADGEQVVGSQRVVHLAGRGYVYPEGLTVVDNPGEVKIRFVDRPHALGTVAYTRPDGNVWTIGGDGAGAAQITGTGAATGQANYYSGLAWSPNGKKLLMRREADAGHDLQLYDSEAGGVRTLYPPQSAVNPNVGAASWSADSFHVIVTDYDGVANACERPSNAYVLRRVDIATGAVTDLYSGTAKGFVAGLSASPGGQSLAVLIGAGCDSVSFGLCLLALQADPVYAVPAGQLRCPAGATAGQVAWSPDGKLLAYTARLQGREDESQLSVGLPLELMEPRGATFYPIAWPLRVDRNIIGVTWLPESRTLRLQEEVPRGLTDTELPDRVLRRITVDGSRQAITEMAADRLVAIRPLLAPAATHGDYALATGARGELWVTQLGQQDGRWQLTDTAAGAAAWSP